MSNIPAELRSLRQWTYSFSKTEPKRPTHYHYKYQGALTFEEAVEEATEGLNYGLYVTKEDPYLLGDIDNVDPEEPFIDLPPHLVALLRKNPTYAEASPSGRGVRFVYRFDAAETKNRVPGFYFKNAEEIQQPDPNPSGKMREAQINFGQPWMRFSGNEVEWSVGEIATIEFSDLEDAFRMRSEEKKQSDLAKRVINTAMLPQISEVVAALKSIPLDQNPRVIRAYEQTFLETYSHYGFWLKLMMAMHNYATLTDNNVECLASFIEWSEQDTLSYKGEEDVYKHWRSLSDGEGFVSYKSLFGVASKYRLFWPRPKKRKEGEPYAPLISEYANFKSLMDYYAIKLYRDATNPDLVYVTGDDDIITRYFKAYNVSVWFDKYYGPFSRDTLIPCLHKMCQDMGFVGYSHNLTTQSVKNLLAETTRTINLIKMYFDTPVEQLPPSYQENLNNWRQSTIEVLFDCIEIDYTTMSEEDRRQEEKLYFSYYKAWLMGFVRNLYMVDSPHMNNCILLLTGAEQVRKTSHFRYLFPKFMREKVAFTTHGFANEGSMRDIVKLSSSNYLIVWDEIEQYLDANTESNFKKVIDNNPQKIIDKYEITEKTIQPISIYGGTSNQREFRLGSEGSRRIFNIPVKWVDTDVIGSLCWHRIINDLKDEMEMELKTGRIPWLLTEEQLQLQRSFHAKIRSRNSLDLLLEEMFHFEQPLTLRSGDHIPGESSLQNAKSERLLTTKQVCDLLMSYGNFGALVSKRPAVIRTLQRLCSEYTGTQRQEAELLQPRCVVKRGEACQGPHKRWVLPPMRSGVKKSMYSQFDGAV